MTDFVLQQDITDIKQRDSIIKYAQFLKQPLQLGMFVPCDLEGDVLEEPDFFIGKYDDNGYGDVDKRKYKEDLKEHQEARERCLFDGFEVNEDEDNFIYITFLFNKNNCKLIFDKESNSFLIDTPVFDEYVEKIEDLIKYNLELTKTAQKQIGL